MRVERKMIQKVSYNGWRSSVVYIVYFFDYIRMKKIMTWDKVIVTAGKWKGSTSTVVSISEKKDPRRGQWVTLKGINTVKRAKKGQGYLEFELPIHISNVALFDEASGTGSKVGIREGKKGNERFYKKSWKAV